MTYAVDVTPTPQDDVAGRPNPVESGLVAAIQQVLQESTEPLTIPKIRVLLPVPIRPASPELLSETLQRQAAASVFWQYPRYRSQHDRFWDRPMPVHVAALLREAVQAGPLPWSELRRKLPAYAQTQAESVLQQQVADGNLYRHPKMGRGGERFGLRPADPKDYLRSELIAVFERLQPLGFSQEQLRNGALELLHDEEWAAKPS